MTVGNARTAAMVLNRFNRDYSDAKGYLSEGSSRAAFLIGGVIYKVPVDCDGDDWANKSEWTNWLKITSKPIPDGIIIPEFSRYDVRGTLVLACTFMKGREVGVCYKCEPDRSYDWTTDKCPGTPECIGTEKALILNGMGITDILLWNVIDTGSALAPIDLA